MRATDLEIEKKIKYILRNRGINPHQVDIDVKNRFIYTRNKTYRFVNVNGSFFLYETKKNKKIIALYPKTKSGNSSKKFLIPPATIVLLLALISSLEKNQTNTYQNPVEILEESSEYQNQEPINLEKSIEVEIDKNPIITTKIVMEETIVDPMINYALDINYDIKPSKHIEKRYETDQIYQKMILDACERYGANYAIISSLITQERPYLQNKESENPAKDPSQTNIGQLTRWVCGEKMCIPLFKKNERDVLNQSYFDYIYVVRDKPKESNFKDYQSYLREQKTYEEQCITSEQLEKKGYKIYHFEDLMNPINNQDCINVSVAYLIHNIKKCNYNIDYGIAAYNSGYPTVLEAVAKNGNRSGINLSGLITIGDPYYNEHVYSFLTSEEYGKIEWLLKHVPNLSDRKDVLTKEEIETFLKEPTTKITMNFTNTKEKPNEQENGYHCGR